MDIMKLVVENEDYMIKMRRHFHVHAEASDYEFETVKTISKELDAMGVNHVVVENGGIMGFIDGEKPGKTVMLRADCDALPMEEDPDNLVGPKVCVSQNPGVCHACGHDGHTAMLLAAAKILNENKDQINGKVVLMFERGEEGTGNFVYLYKYIRDNNIHIDSVYGIHLYAELEAGKVSIREGNVMAGAMTLDFVIKGKGGHGSRPDQSVNPIDCFVAIYTGFNTIRTRHISPFNTLTDVICVAHVGTMKNIIKDTIEFSGGVRTFEMEDAKIYKKEMKNMVLNTCAAYNCEAQVCEIKGPMIAVKNDPECAKMARRVVGNAIGEEHMELTDPWMASDCMSYHLAQWPGVYTLVGIKNDEKGVGAAHHNGHFDLDEDVLKLGAASAVAYALGFLKSDIDTSKSPLKWNGTIIDLLKETERKPDWIAVLEN